jgi:hypothetical protein
MLHDVAQAAAGGVEASKHGRDGVVHCFWAVSSLTRRAGALVTSRAH